MMRAIGVLYQDVISLGFLKGLQARLDCNSELVPPPAAIAKNAQMTRRDAQRAAAYFRAKGVDLIVRFTDADRQRWQEVRRKEPEVFPRDAQDILVCGVARECVEDWLALDLPYAAAWLGVDEADLRDKAHRTGRVKNAIRGMRGDEDLSDLVAAFVRDARPEVFRRWLNEPSLAQFYADCRAAAMRQQCDVPNELQD